MARVLVIDDEELLAESLRSGLEDDGFTAEIALNGEDGYFRLLNDHYDVVVMDWMLPGRDGLTVLRALRERHIDVPVLLLTARDTVEDRVAGLKTGADDFLAKPFEFAELSARLRALLRRSAREGSSVLRASDLCVDVVKRTVSRCRQLLDLTKTELELLMELLRHKNHIVSRAMLAEAVWGDSAEATSLHNVLDVHLSRLRKKVDHPFEHSLIETVRGVGFRIRDGQ